MFPLLDLPYVPLRRVMRYLDEKSLRQTQLLCSSLFSFINKNKRQTAVTNIFRVKFKRVRYTGALITREQRPLDVFVSMVVDKTNERQTSKTFYFPVCIDSTGEWENFEEISEEIGDEKIINENPWKWMSTHFVNVRITLFCIEQVNFCETDIALLERMLQKNKAEVTLVTLGNTLYNERHAELLLRLTLAFSSGKLQVFEKNPAHTRLLMTSFFCDCMSILKVFMNFSGFEEAQSPDWIATAEIPSNCYTFPPIFAMGPGLLLSMSSLRKALQEWFANRQIIKVWAVLLPVEYADVHLFTAELGVPYVTEMEGNGNSLSRIKIKNCVGEEHFIRSVVYTAWKNSKVSCWYIGDHDPRLKNQ